MCSAQSYLTLLQPYGTVAYQAPLSMDFPGKNTGVGLPFPSAGDIFNPGIAPASPESSVLAGRFFTAGPRGEALVNIKWNKPGTER